ncbi:MAG: argininosuccinate lyase, partial [Adhaeribacter sp.]
MKLWQKDIQVKQEVEQFTVGKDRELDLLLAPYDVLGSLAHTRMLNSINLLDDEDLALVQRELKNIYQEIMAGNFTIEE